MNSKSERELSCKLSVIVIWLSLSIGVRTGTAQNLIVNGNFSAGNAAFQSGYTFAMVNDAGPGDYTVSANPHSWNSQFPAPPTWADHSGTGDNLALLVNGATVPGVDIWRETVSVANNTPYQLSAWACDLVSAYSGGHGRLQMFLNGSPIGSFFDVPDGLQWNSFSAQLTTSATTTSVTLSIRDLDITSVPNDFAIDDISLIAIVPEPPSGALWCTGSIFLLIAYRRSSPRENFRPGNRFSTR